MPLRVWLLSRLFAMCAGAQLRQYPPLLVLHELSLTPHISHKKKARPAAPPPTPGPVPLRECGLLAARGRAAAAGGWTALAPWKHGSLRATTASRERRLRRSHFCLEMLATRHWLAVIHLAKAEQVE